MREREAGLGAAAVGPRWLCWVEALVIALLIQGLTGVTLLAGYAAYLAGLTAVGRSGANGWLARPGEAGLVLLLGLVAGGWLTGVWLGERLRRGWLALGLVVALLSLPLTHGLYLALGVAAQPARFAVAGLTPAVLWLVGPAAMVVALLVGGVIAAWWVGLARNEA